MMNWLPVSILYKLQKLMFRVDETALMEANGWNFEKCNMIQQHEKTFIEEDLKMYNGTYNHSSCSTKEQYAKRIVSDV